MNETIAKLTPHIPIDELSLDNAVSTAKSVKGNIEQRYKRPPRKRKTRIVIPALVAFVVGAVVATKILRDRNAAQPAPSAPAEHADAARRAATN